MQNRRIPQRASRTADYPIAGEYDDVWPPRQPTSGQCHLNKKRVLLLID